MAAFLLTIRKNGTSMQFREDGIMEISGKSRRGNTIAPGGFRRGNTIAPGGFRRGNTIAPGGFRRGNMITPGGFRRGNTIAPGGFRRDNMISPGGFRSKGSGGALLRKLYKYRHLYIMALPVIAFYALFHYQPMYGAIIAFKQFSPGLGIWGSPWIGLENFTTFFNDIYFVRILRNTVLISFYNLIFGFPAPILLALLLNELRSIRFKGLVQSISYMPHFLSTMIICGMIVDFAGSKGIINDIVYFLGGTRSALLQRPELFRTLYVSTDIWQHVGWNTVIYVAALSGIDQQLYEAARIDGAGRLKQLLNITLPGIAPTITILLILRSGQIMNVGFEKIFLLYNPLTYETADVISTFVYRKGMLEFAYSYSAAVGLFNSLINFTLLMCVNWISRKISESSLL